MEFESHEVWVRESRRVEWRDTDASGHHHNSAVMRMVEATEVALYRDLGIVPVFSESPRVHQEINFRSVVYFDDLIVVTVRLRRVGRTSMTFDFDLSVEAPPEEGGRAVADGSFTTVHLPRGAARSAPWSSDVIEALARARASAANR